MKHRLFIIIFIFFLQIGCSVNSTTGLLEITNLSDRTIKNLKLDNTLILSSLDKGAKYDYWYFNTFEGKISCEGADEILVSYYIEKSKMLIYKDNAICSFKTNYKYQIEMRKLNGKYRVYVSEGINSDGSDVDFPAK
ncbi:MAG: hypothetical protein A2086_03855 [Spirochaetes bacterium GWD1_27_9]|nr:MAG: hypothetical protein A2Z98_08720 [Spirochaetes bacterium GWB1_27_13]OHD24039.1 MAG: hypothetical protein A2Y34_14025 [Spirochaetes bacterium GWC1_27_15]OHD30679.1 MAG: hypothetical protein A2086_03855 [Spirochaetes bacterium GWD1_27_9]